MKVVQKVVQIGGNLDIETESSSVMVVFRCGKIGTEIVVSGEWGKVASGYEISDEWQVKENG